MPADDTKLVVASHNTHHTRPKSPHRHVAGAAILAGVGNTT